MLFSISCNDEQSISFQRGGIDGKDDVAGRWIHRDFRARFANVYDSRVISMQRSRKSEDPIIPDPGNKCSPTMIFRYIVTLVRVNYHFHVWRYAMHTSRKFNCVLTFGSKKRVSIEIEIRFSEEISCGYFFYLV